MPAEESMKAALQAYIDGFNNGDAGAIAALYAPDAVVADPVGAAEIAGIEAITEFYRGAVASGAELVLDAPIRGSHGDRAAMAFTVTMPTMRIRVIDVFTFAEDGRFARMEAHWGPSDIEQ